MSLLFFVKGESQVISIRLTKIKITILNVLKTKFELSDEMFKFHINNVYTFFKSISFDFISIQADSSLRLLNKEKKYLTKIISKIKDFDLSIETIKLNTMKDQASLLFRVLKMWILNLLQYINQKV